MDTLKTIFHVLNLLKLTDAEPLIHWGGGGSVVSPLLTVACGASSETPAQYPCYVGSASE